MALAALTNVFSTGTLLAAPVTALSLIPILALGINYYRYQSIDPEGRPIDAERVRPISLSPQINFNNIFHLLLDSRTI